MNDSWHDPQDSFVFPIMESHSLLFCKLSVIISNENSFLEIIIIKAKINDWPYNIRRICLKEAHPLPEHIGRQTLRKDSRKLCLNYLTINYHNLFCFICTNKSQNDKKKYLRLTYMYCFWNKFVARSKHDLCLANFYSKYLWIN